jgi:hypothetical protein
VQDKFLSRGKGDRTADLFTQPALISSRIYPGQTQTATLMLGIGTAAIAMLIYLLTLAPDLTWANASADGGELITASVTLGIPHPPGYPTYILLGKLFSFIPVGTIAFRFNLFSAVCMALATGLLAMTIVQQERTSTPSRLIGMAAALTFAFTPLVWSQAVVAEVYALNMLMVSAFLFLLLRRGVNIGSGLFLGLALTTHLTAVFLIPLAIFLPVKRNWSRFIWGMGLGLLPLLVLPLLATGKSPVVWGDPTNIKGWLWLVSGRLYSANIQFPPDINRALMLLQAIVVGPGLMLISRRNNWRTNRELLFPITTERRTRGVLAVSITLYVVFALLYTTSDAAVLLLPALLMLAILGASFLNPLKAGALLIPLLLLVSVFPGQNQRGGSDAREIAESILRSAPEGAILMAPGDRTIFTLWYFQHVEHQRPDIYLVDSNLFAFEWYRARLGAQFPKLIVPVEDDLAAFRTENSDNHAFCSVGLVHLPFKSNGHDLFGGPIPEQITPQLACMEINP